MTNERPGRVISIDGGKPAPVSGSSMDAAIAGLEHASGRVEVAPATRVRITAREARALDLQNNGFAVHTLRNGPAIRIPLDDVMVEGQTYPSFLLVAHGRIRVRVTLEQWHGRPAGLLEENCYLWAPGAEYAGLDPWRVVDGLDRWPDRAGLPDAYELWLASGRSIRGLPSTFPVYVTERAYAELTRQA